MALLPHFRIVLLRVQEDLIIIYFAIHGNYFSYIEHVKRNQSIKMKSVCWILSPLNKLQYLSLFFTFVIFIVLILFLFNVYLTECVYVYIYKTIVIINQFKNYPALINGKSS